MGRLPAVLYGEVVVVSGATGFIGSHIADQLLAGGYQVRGTTRSVQKGAWLEEFFQGKYGSGNFELKGVPDRQLKALLTKLWTVSM